MTYHKIRGIDKTVCTAEAKIAYNLASTYAYWQRKEYREDADKYSRIAVTEFISEAIAECIRMWKGCRGAGKYDIDAVNACLNAGMENYFKEPYGILTSYEAIGKVFPSLYL